MMWFLNELIIDTKIDNNYKQFVNNLYHSYQTQYNKNMSLQKLIQNKVSIYEKQIQDLKQRQTIDEE